MLIGSNEDINLTWPCRILQQRPEDVNRVGESLYNFKRLRGMCFIIFPKFCLYVIGNYNILKFCNVEIDEENLLSLLIGDLLTMIYSKNSIYPIIDSPFNTFALFYVEKRLFLSDDFLTVVAVVATFHCL